MHVMARDAEAVYPLRHEGVHVCPEGVGDTHDVYDVEEVLEGTVHGFGLHTPAGEENAPRVHVIARDPVTLYPVWHDGVHCDPD